MPSSLRTSTFVLASFLFLFQHDNDNKDDEDDDADDDHGDDESFLAEELAENSNVQDAFVIAVEQQARWQCFAPLGALYNYDATFAVSHFCLFTHADNTVSQQSLKIAKLHQNSI